MAETPPVQRTAATDVEVTAGGASRGPESVPRRPALSTGEPAAPPPAPTPAPTGAGLLGDEPLTVGSGLDVGSPVQRTARITTADVELAGHAIGKGAMVVTALGAANRDPAQFTDPDRLDVTRRDVRHISFGHGIHFCLGAPLARVEGQIALGTLLRRTPRLTLAEAAPEWRESSVLRGLKRLNVTF